MNNNNNNASAPAWFGASQLAGLPGLPATVQGVNVLAKRADWASRPKAGRGGGREYPLSSLPVETRTALAARLDTDAARAGRHEGRKLALQERISDEAAHNRRLSGLKTSIQQPVKGQQRIDAKLAIVSAFERFHKASGLAIRVARPDFARRYNAGEIEIDPAVRALQSRVSDSAIWRWSRAIKSDGITRLAGAYGNRRGESIIDRQPALHEFTISMLVQHPHCTIGHVTAAMRARFNGHNGIDYPSPRALQRWVTNWKRDNQRVFTALNNPDAWKNTYMSSFGSQSEDVERVNQRWELDSTPGDVMLTDGRHAVIGVVDVKSRRGRLLVAKTSKATAIATLLRHTLLAWGVPEEAKTDNGSDYVSHHITRVFASLEVEQVLCPPFQPWHKPHVESFFRTFSHGLVELLPGFIGHSVAERQAIEARASFADRLLKRGGALDVSMSAAEFQKFCDDWCEAVYLHQPHHGLKGKSPFEVLAASRDPIRAVDDPRALDVLLADAPANNGKRTVQKKGIELDRAWFIAPELALHVGEDVHVRLDPLDLGRIYVFDVEEGFICVAECPERTGMDRREVAIKAKAIQLADTQEQKRALKATAKRVRTQDVVHEILVERAEAAGKLSRLPGPVTNHASAGLAAAAEAARAAPVPADAAFFEAQPRKVIVLDSPEINYKRWLSIDARTARGDALTEDEAAWHHSYRDSDEWRSQQKIAADFPEEYRLQM